MIKTEINTFVTSKNYRYTKGKEYCLGYEEYVGEYHFRGASAYTGPIKGDDSKKLTKYHPSEQVLRYNELNPASNKILTYVEPTRGFVYPNENAYSDGSFFRFFVKRRIPPYDILEIDLDQAKSYATDGGIDPVIYQLGQLKWHITRTYSKLKFVETENKKSTIIENYKMQGLATNIYSYTEFSEISI
jgi:hypothetical protein